MIMKKFNNYIIVISTLLFIITSYGQLAGEQKNYSDYFSKTIEKPSNFAFSDYSKEGNVDPLTGRFGINIDFHTIKTDYINIPISLSYSTSGIHLDAISNEIGMDWSLLAGGQISRTINGLQDDAGPMSQQDYRFSDNLGNLLSYGGDISTGTYGTNVLSTLKVGYGNERGSGATLLGSWHTTNFPERRQDDPGQFSVIGSLVDHARLAKFPVSNEFSPGLAYTIDTEPDIFRCKVGDLDFSFILKRKAQYFSSYGGHSPELSSEEYFEAVPIDEIGIKIKIFKADIPFYDKRKNFSVNGRDREVNKVSLIKFEVTDKKGIVYTFEKFDFIDSDYIDEAFLNTQFGINNQRVLQWKTYNTSINNWKLTNVLLPDKTSIQFTYMQNKYLFKKQIPRTHDGPYAGNIYNLSPSMPNYGLKKLDTQFTGHSISEVSYLNQKIKFKYTTYRPDMFSGGLNLNGIELWYKDERLIRSFNLQKVYSYADRDNNHQDYRMFLSAITDSYHAKSYKFTYNSIDALPSRSHVKHQDLFGYYLGYQSQSNNEVAFPTVYIDPNDVTGNKISYERPRSIGYITVNSGSDRAVKTNAVLSGAVQKIEFPTGGTLEVLHENNTYYDPKLFSSKSLGPGVRAKRLQYFSDMGKLSKQLEYNYDQFSISTRSSGTLLYKPSLAHISNLNLNNSVNRQVQVESTEYDIYDFYGRWDLYDFHTYQDHYTKEMWQQNGFPTNAIYPKMIRLSTHSLGNTSDVKGREIVYSNVRETSVDFDNPNNSHSVRYYFSNTDNRARVSSARGPSDEPSEHPKGEKMTGSYGFNPFYENLKTTSGFTEHAGYDIFPFPQRDFFSSNLNNRLFGRLLKKEFYDSTQNRILTEDYYYGMVSTQDIDARNNELNSLKHDHLRLHQYDPSDNNKIFQKIYKNISGPYLQADVNNYNGLYLFANSKIKYNAKVVLQRKQTTTHFATGDVVQQHHFEYDNNALGSIARERFQNSEGETFTKFYNYPTINDDKPWLATLKARNMMDPYWTFVKRDSDGKEITSTEYMYKLWANDMLLLEKIAEGKYIDDAEIKLNVLRRDASGNVLEYKEGYGAPVSLIYGYGGTLLVAKLENITYDQIPQSIITAIHNATAAFPYNEANVISALNNIRSVATLGKGLITTYTHRPLVGVSRITDHRNYSHTYHYDAAGRLEFVKDNDGNIVSETQYRYRTQN